MTLTADLQYGMELSRLVSQQALQVADEAVHVAFPSCLSNDVFVVVVPETAAQLFIVHLGFILSLTPQQRHLGTMTDIINNIQRTKMYRNVVELRGITHKDNERTCKLHMEKTFGFKSVTLHYTGLLINDNRQAVANRDLIKLI